MSSRATSCGRSRRARASQARQSDHGRARRSEVRRRGVLLSLLALAVPAARASDPGTGDWPMWGGAPDRNMVSGQKGLPTEWDVKTKRNVKWTAALGSVSYGNPV